MKKIVIGIIVVILLGIAGYFGYQQLSQPKLMSRDDVKKEIASDESVLSEAAYFTQLTAKGKTTMQYTSVHAQSLQDQLQSSQKTFSSVQVEKALRPVIFRQQTVLAKAISALDTLTNSSDSTTAGSTEKILQTLFLTDERIDDSL